jgi:hypothetical protein
MRRIRREMPGNCGEWNEQEKYEPEDLLARASILVDPLEASADLGPERFLNQDTESAGLFSSRGHSSPHPTCRPML